MASYQKNSDEPFAAPYSELDAFYKQYETVINANRQRQEDYSKHKEELNSVLSHLKVLPNELSYDVMIPIGSQGLMRGKMVHTNEILALIGDGWCVKTSATHAMEICQRRIQRCDEMLNKYSKELELLNSWSQVSSDVFQPPEENVQEIIEDYDEEKEKDWSAIHKENVRKHYLELAALRKGNKVEDNEEEILQRRLDELELQEEMEDEQIRSEENVNESTSDSEDYSDIEDSQKDSDGEILNSKREVSFSQVLEEVEIDSEKKNPEPLRIFFHHSDIGEKIHGEICDGDQEIKSSELESPADVYYHFKSLFANKATPKSILKQNIVASNVEGNEHLQDSHMSLSDETLEGGMERLGNYNNKDEEKNEEELHQSIAFGDVIVEHKEVSFAQKPEEIEQQKRPVSRFKASRQKKKNQDN